MMESGALRIVLGLAQKGDNAQMTRISSKWADRFARDHTDPFLCSARSARVAFTTPNSDMADAHTKPEHFLIRALARLSGCTPTSAFGC
jgi:hypothetical protein